jgi:hypothetical protein
MNCRFLQGKEVSSGSSCHWTEHVLDLCLRILGPGTSPQSIQRLRQALKQGLPCVELLLNYKADGTPFYCLLSIIPLFDEKGFLSCASRRSMIPYIITTLSDLHLHPLRLHRRTNRMQWFHSFSFLLSSSTLVSAIHRTSPTSCATIK